MNLEFTNRNSIKYLISLYIMWRVVLGLRKRSRVPGMKVKEELKRENWIPPIQPTERATATTPLPRRTRGRKVSSDGQ